MIRAHLGETIDIHGGGQDLVFPHHENERAQSCCAHGGDFVRYWMHNAYLNIDGEKMAKSLGNFRMVRDLLEQFPGEVLRFALLSAHYRSPLNFSAELLEQSRASLDGLYGALRKVQHIELDTEVNLEGEAFYTALNDDLNTPVAIAEMHALARAMNKGEEADKPALKARLLAAADLMGILQQDPEAWFKGTTLSGTAIGSSTASGDLTVGDATVEASGDAMSAETVEALIEERRQARLDGDYARADEIRQTLDSRGVVLEDSREGTTWRRR